MHRSKSGPLMSGRGHERRFCDVCGTSALLPTLTVTADILNRQIRATSGLMHCNKMRGLFDHLVGAGEQGGWHVEAEGLGGLQIDDQLVLGRRLHRKVGGLFSLEEVWG